MNFEEAKEKLIRDGFEEKNIRRMKCRLSNKGVWPVWEEQADTPALEGDDTNFSSEAKIIRYKLDKGNLDPSKKEFWVPCAFDGYKQWTVSYCAPDWLETKRKKNNFCAKHYEEKSWPDEGETSPNPIQFVNSELSLLRPDSEFNGSSEIPKKHKEKAKQEIDRLGELAFDYLAKAVELSLAENEPDYRQVTIEKMQNGEAMTQYCEKVPVEIIELAFRAGRLSERLKLHIRGIPAIAEQGYPMVKIGGEHGNKKLLADCCNIEQAVAKCKKEDPTRKPEKIFKWLLDKNFIEAKEGLYRIKGKQKWVKKESIKKRFKRLPREN